MKAIVFSRYAGPDALELQELDTPTPAAGEVLIRVHAVSVNDWDLGLLRGTPLLNRLQFGLFKPGTRIIGSDVAGRVEAVGRDVTALRAGDLVYGDLSGRWGGFAEYVCAPAGSLTRKPEAMTFEEAAALPQVVALALQGLFDVGRLRRGEKVLVNGAGGGVGTLVVQLAKLHDAELTGVDRGSKLDRLRALGFDHVVDYLEEDFARSGRTYDLILDAKTSRSPGAHLRALNPGGRYVTVGGAPPRLLQALCLGPWSRMRTGKQVRLVFLRANKDMAHVNELFESGSLRPVIDRTFPLREAGEAMRYYAEGDFVGKVVLTVPGAG
jgi:NADPH:quinone reductase-like Zn-dependent oxidoreductase